MATQPLAGDKSTTLGVVESTPSSSNNTLVAQNEDIYMGDGDVRQGLEVELEQLLKVSFFILQAPFVNDTYWITLLKDDLWTLVKMNSITLPVCTYQTTHKTR